MNTILSNILPDDIYCGFSPMPESITGWGGDDPIFEQMVRQVRPRVILEVGTWKGQSAITMAEACRANQLDCAIICVDTWLGSVEHVLKDRRALRLVNGYPSIYYQFLSNVVHRNVQDWIVPFPTTSLTGANILAQLGVQANIIYIDANHEYDAVFADLRAYHPLLAIGGVMFGHDYGWESVRRAVEEFCVLRGASHRVEGDFWVLQVE